MNGGKAESLRVCPVDHKDVRLTTGCLGIRTGVVTFHRQDRPGNDTPKGEACSRRWRGRAEMAEGPAAASNVQPPGSENVRGARFVMLPTTQA